MKTNKPFLAAVLLLSAALALCPARAMASGTAAATAGNQIKITSDGQLDMCYGQGEAVFTDNVQVRDDLGPLLTCEKLTVFFVDQNTISRLEAEENVFLFHEDMVGHCSHAQYTVATELAVMSGDPVIRKGQDTYAADIIRINRADGRVLFEPSARLVVFPQGEDPLNLSARDNAAQPDAAAQQAAPQAQAEEQQ